jgi:glucose-6-phosphate isomerase
MSLKLEFNTFTDLHHPLFSLQYRQHMWSEFEQVIENPANGFFNYNPQHDIKKCQTILSRFSDRETLIHIGIGGSALGPEMMIQAFGGGQKKIVLLNNIDSDDIYEKLQGVDLKKSVIYAVSKSGGTAETVACLSFLIQSLQEQGVATAQLKNYVVICTDQEKGDLRELVNELELLSMHVPSNIGGRFSTQTAVGLLPADFCGVDIDLFAQGLASMREEIIAQKENSILVKLFCHLAFLYQEQKVNQTVLMPYSSKLKVLSSWFVQLWAESLGKENIGFTPIAAYGATDQHSQMQLFMQGPKDKCLILIDRGNAKHDQKLFSQIQKKSFDQLKHFSMDQLMRAELEGTIEALKKMQRPSIVIRCEKNNEKTLGAIILLLESLTALMGTWLKIDPFNQPGVEAGKIYAYEWLKKTR